MMSVCVNEANTVLSMPLTPHFGNIWVIFFANITKIVLSNCEIDSTAKMYPNSIMARALPQTPLVELTVLPQTTS